MEPKIFQIILIMLFLISGHSRELNSGGERKTKSPEMSSVSSTPSGSSGSAQGPNWDSSWGWGSSPGAGWGYGSGSGRSSDGSGRGYGFGFGSGTGSGSGAWNAHMGL
ncbi:glycine-rich protein DOT1-like [Forsythia ovata]|uniref:Glycine-rich protein DOT1-like n=1 Tax=Forsythia ovata TaxID=205694 RepID=A0ABD1X1V6_9LAMI